jgi:hypothetical protein
MRNPFLPRKPQSTSTTEEPTAAAAVVDGEDDFVETLGVDRPCKISIPMTVVQRSKREYRPRSRRDYDPQDSISIANYLHQGYAPFNADRRRRGAEEFSASIKQQVRLFAAATEEDNFIGLNDADNEMLKENFKIILPDQMNAKPNANAHNDGVVYVVDDDPVE